MRWLGRLLRRILLAVTVLAVGLAVPVVYVETMCRGDGVPAPATPLSGETRPEVRTLLTYPEWHIVHAYDDYAEVIRQGDPHDFGYFAAIGGYWSTLCTLTGESAALGEIDTATRQLVHVIGVSFTFEMLMKAAYEETVGRAVTLLRGAERAPLDDLSAEQAAAYAVFLQQVPWYRYDFRADAAALDAASTGTLRDRERVLALGLEHRARAAYAGVIADAVAATGQDDLTLQMVVRGLPADTLAGVEGVTVLREIEEGIEVETPAEHIEPVRKIEGEVEILFHEDDRHLALLAELPDDPSDELDDVGLDALGRLVHQEHARAGDERARDGELLLLSPGQVAAAAVFHVLEHGEMLEDAIGDGVVAPWQAGEPGLEVLAHGQQRKDHPALRHVADAHLGQPVGRQDRNILPVEHQRAARPCVIARDGFHEGGLADPVRAHHAGHFPALGAHGDAVEDLAAAVVKREVSGFQHLSARGRLRSRARRA
jgi:hypothetical protein